VLPAAASPSGRLSKQGGAFIAIAIKGVNYCGEVNNGGAGAPTTKSKMASSEIPVAARHAFS
jgi:hypothetical protein